jgi:hypothetical protein
MPGGWPIDIAEDATESGIINASEQGKSTLR